MVSAREDAVGGAGPGDGSVGCARNLSPARAGSVSARAASVSAALVAAVLVVSACGSGATSHGHPTDDHPLPAGSAAASAAAPTAPSSSEAAGSPSSSAAATFRSVREYAGVAEPVRLRIPAAGVDSALERVGLTATDWIAAPGQWQVAGWYEGGPRPGQKGTAVIVGHVDSREGPAVFHALPELRIGSAVHVDRRDGSTVSFQVTSRRQVPKDSFPAEEVYAPTLQPALLLMTCGGVFDRARGHYKDNVLLTAVPADST